MKSAIAAAPALPGFVEWIRVSTEDQEKRDTPAIQIRDLVALRDRRPGILVETIQRTGSGATDTADRSDFQRLSTLLRTGRVQEVRVWRLDRATRHPNPAERFAVYSIVAEAGAVFVDATGRVTDPKTELGELDFYIQTMVAASERKRTGERTAAGKRRLAALGRLVEGDPPFGRTFDKDSGAWGLHPERAALYRRMFSMCLSGLSLAQIALKLNEEGLQTPRGNPYSDSGLSTLLRSRTAVGEYKTKRGTITLEPIVEEATFQAAQERLKANNSLSGPRPKVFALLRKLSTCGACGSPLYLQLGGGTPARYRYYYCSAHDPACFVYHRQEDIEAKVIDLLRRWLDDPTTLARAAGRDAPEDAHAALEREVGEAERELKDLDRQETWVSRQGRRRLISQKVAEQQLTEIQRARPEAEKQLAAARARLDSAQRNAAVARDLSAAVERVRSGMLGATPEKWRELCEVVFPRGGVQVFPDGRIELRGRVSLAEPLPNPSGATPMTRGIRNAQAPGRQTQPGGTTSAALPKLPRGRGRR